MKAMRFGRSIFKNFGCTLSIPIALDRIDKQLFKTSDWLTQEKLNVGLSVSGKIPVLSILEENDVVCGSEVVGN